MKTISSRKFCEKYNLVFNTFNSSIKRRLEQLNNISKVKISKGTSKTKRGTNYHLNSHHLFFMAGASMIATNSNNMIKEAFVLLESDGVPDIDSKEFEVVLKPRTIGPSITPKSFRNVTEIPEVVDTKVFDIGDDTYESTVIKVPDNSEDYEHLLKLYSKSIEPLKVNKRQLEQPGVWEKVSKYIHSVIFGN